MTPDVRARELAGRQHGVISRDQLMGCGLTKKQIHVRVRRAELLRELPGVYRAAGYAMTFLSKLKALVLWLGEPTVIGGPAAAFLLGLEGVDEPARITVYLDRHVRAPAWVEAKRCRDGRLPRARWHRGFRVCEVERVLLDCAARLPGRALKLALDDALRKRLTTPARLRRFLGSCGSGWHGKALLARLVAERNEHDARLRSRFEALMLAILRRIRGLRVEPDHRVEAGGNVYYIDFYLPQAHLGIECHSFAWHVARHDHDARRHRAIAALGIELLYFTWDDVARHPAKVEAEIRAAIARRSGLLGA
jgi:very-short-patch-repair endonuclease